MFLFRRWLFGVFALGALCLLVDDCRAVSLNFSGTHYDIGDTFFPGGIPYHTVPWHSDSASNSFATADTSPDRYYGKDGYALFATYFSYPDQNIGYNGSVDDPIFTANNFYIDLINLPEFVTDSQILSTRKAAGYEYALIDDPQLQEGIRWWTFDGQNYPPPDGTNTTGEIPYVKIGLLNGSDILGNDPATTPTGRWGFEVGSNVPASFRVGVMTDGLDAAHFAAAEVFLSHVVDESIVTTVTSSEVTRNRFVDIHFFDITGAQPGDQFAFSAMKSASDPDFTSAGISGITFDVIPIEAPLGDYNGNGLVDAADYTVWRDSLGQSVTPGTGADGTGPGGTPDGLVDALDYDFWKEQFGLSSGEGALAPQAVPEPASFVLILGVAIAGLLVPRRRMV